ncbi:uncharacterized protein LOC121735853 [Aricia agestis]|uniref:uncharacterized protein LOC121735853 n=1 Tax=Aricia agestis TaxID=91739 RepID=UPI001C20AC89|nr:uncharacterized protein LOC121735853 [Aricia agestis]
MLKICIFFSVLCSTVMCQENWGSRACMVNPQGYYAQVMQETVTELENEVRWSNFKMDDLTTPVDIELYNWHVVGTVNFTNGFLVSIENIDISNFIPNIGTSTATLRGNLNFHNMKVGFDVAIDFEGHELTRVTGVFVYRIVSWTYFLTRNLLTNETTITSLGASASGASTRMEFLPASNLTEIASRMYFAYSSSDSFPRWGREIQEVVLRKAQEIEFPEIRFDNNC